MELRDKNGLTEAEFLASYSPKNYERPSLTADIAVFAQEADRLRLLLIRRGGHPYLGCWALPGGFAKKNETIETTAARELREETGLEGLSFAPVGLFTAPGRDPRMWVVSQAFVAIIPVERTGEIRAGDDAAAARWFDVAVTQEGEQAAIRLSAEGTTLSAKLRLRSVGTIPALQTVTTEVLENGGLAFDHGEIIAQALCRLGYINSNRTITKLL